MANSTHIRDSRLSAASSYSPFAIPLFTRLLVARQDVTGAFPGREEIELPELLRQAHRLINDALLLVVVTDLDETGERKVLAQRVALESIIGQQPAHVRVAAERHTVEIVGLALEPVGAREDADDR